MTRIGTGTYKLECHGCHHTVELPGGSKAGKPEMRTCPHCGAQRQIEWRDFK